MTSDELTTEECYKVPDEIVRPGDIVRLSPVLRACRPPLQHLGPNKRNKGVNRVADIFGHCREVPIAPRVAEGRDEAELVLKGKLDLGILLTRGCDIDHGRIRQLAWIRPLSVVGDAKAQAAVIDGKHLSMSYLPEARIGDSLLFADSFIDFRYLMTLDQDLFSLLTRVISLTRSTLANLYYDWMLHTIGRDVPETIACSTCDTPVDVFGQIITGLTPQIDY